MTTTGYVRVIGKAGVYIATSSPGITNLITGLTDALLDSIPVAAVTDQVSASFIGTNAFQEVDIPGLSLARTKYNLLVQSLGELLCIMAEAFDVASSGRPGPVLVGIPKDIQLASGDLEPWLTIVENEVTFLHAEVEQVRQVLVKAQRPMLYVGGDMGMAQTVSISRGFLAATKIPATHTLKGLGVVEADYPYYLSVLGIHDTKATNLVMQEHDLLIAMGTRLNDRMTGKLNTFTPHAGVIRMDTDPAEMNKLRQAHVALQGDLNTLLPASQQPLNIDN